MASSNKVWFCHLYLIASLPFFQNPPLLGQRQEFFHRLDIGDSKNDDIFHMQLKFGFFIPFTLFFTNEEEIFTKCTNRASGG
jgi:hypothetical protein